MHVRLLSVVAIATCIVTLSGVVGAGDAEAQRGRRGRGRRSATAAAPEEAPTSAAIAESLGELRWGLGPRETFDLLARQVEGTYRERLAAARRTDAIAEDRIRQQMDADQRRLRSSYVRFNGEASGWDTSFVRDEFTQNNNESMMVWRDEASHSQRYYFFINDRLWKVYQAFDSSVFPGATFDQFSEGIQGRFGRGVERSGALVEGRQPVRWVEWQDGTTRLRAVDQTRFYGFFCLVFEDKATLAQLPTLRANRAASGPAGHAMVESILREDEAQPGGSEAHGDAHADIADRITGNTRRRQEAPAGAAGTGGTGTGGTGTSAQPAAAGRTGAAAPAQQPAQQQRRGSSSDDPFEGMAL